MWCDTFLLCRACFWLHFTFIVTDNGCKQELFRNNQVSFANDYDRLQNILNRNRNNSVISFMNIPKKFYWRVCYWFAPHGQRRKLFRA